MTSAPPNRLSVELHLDCDLVREAENLGVTVATAAEDGLRRAVAHAKSEQWKRENAESIASFNAYVEENGLPLARYRPF